MTMVRKDSWEVGDRLGMLGLNQERLLDVARNGMVAFANCTENHPRFIHGIWAWGETVRALREYLLPLGWSRSDENNYPIVVDPFGEIAIAVATGDEFTGVPDYLPSTKSAKGPSTFDAVNGNAQYSLDFGVSIAATGADRAEERLTWILLTHRAYREVRCELSLPNSMGPDGKIDGWQERILLGSVPLDGEFTIIAPPELPEILVDVKRRA